MLSGGVDLETITIPIHVEVTVEDEDGYRATKSVGENAETLLLESQEQVETSSEFTSLLSELLVSLGKSLLEWIMDILQTKA